MGGTGEPGPSVLLARLCRRARAASVLLCPALVRGTMEALQHVPALELQLQVRGGAAGHAQPCQPSPGPRPAHSSQSAGGRYSEGPRVLMGRAPAQAPPGGTGGGGVTRGREALKPCRRPPEGATGSPEPLETHRRGPASLQPPLGAACSEHLALFTSPRPHPVGERAPPGPARARTTRHPGWSVLVLLVGGDVGTPRYPETQEA